MRRIPLVVAPIVVVIAFLARTGQGEPPAVAPAPNALAAGSLRAVLWEQTAAEHEACTLQAYRLAERLLLEALADCCWTADVEQAAAGDYAGKPPAVVLDVDETVLDNSPAQARLVRGVVDGTRESDAYTIPDWEKWVYEKKARALPGARRFLRFAKERGVATYFITNRIDAQRAATAENLVAVGIEASVDTVITSNPDAGRPSDKTSRRKTVAATHRILLLVGDDMNDFVGGTRKVKQAERAAVLEKHRDYVGTKWVILPNAVYGGWMDALGEKPTDALRVDGWPAPK